MFMCDGEAARIRGFAVPFLNFKILRQATARWLLFWLVVGCGQTVFAIDLIGYLPHYRMNSSYNVNWLPDQLAMLDEIRYFGLTIDSGGAIAPLGGSGTLSAHYSRIATIKQAIEALPAGDRPRLNITLGGAGEATAYATVAANATLRSTLATNVKSMLDTTGAVSVDVDWEHPSGAADQQLFVASPASQARGRTRPPHLRHDVAGDLHAGERFPSARTRSTAYR